MVDLQQYEEYWSGITERIPQIKKVVPVTFDPDMGALVQLIIPSAKGKSPDVDNLLELNLCVAFLMDKTDPQRKGTYQVLKELQPVMEKMKAQMIDDKAAGCHLLSRLDLSSLSTIPEAGFYSVFAGWSLGFEFETP